MHRIDGAGNVGGMYVGEDAATNRPPTEVTPEHLNAMQEELSGLVEWAGLALNKGDNTQVRQALLEKFAGLDAGATKAGVQAQIYTAFTTGGASGAFTLTPNPAITAYAAGQRFRAKFHAAGTGTDTVNVSGLGAKSVKQYDSSGSKAAAVIAAGQLVDAEYDGVDMVLLDPLPPALPSPFPPGAVIHVAQSTAPSGFLKANGALVSRTAYAALFSAIGTTFGVGDGGTTFTLPDLRGEFIRGWDDGRGVDAGRNLGTAQSSSAIANYVHSESSSAGAFAAIAVGIVNPDVNGPLLTWINANYFMGAGSATSGGTAYAGTQTLRPRNIALLACIKY